MEWLVWITEKNRLYIFIYLKNKQHIRTITLFVLIKPKFLFFLQIDVLPWSMKRKVALGGEHHLTISTGVCEQVGKVLGLHMVSGTRTVLMWKVFTKSTMKFSIFQVLSHKLKQLLGILESVACIRKKWVLKWSKFWTEYFIGY